MEIKVLNIFVKNPVLGSVKTRLAAKIGKERALSIYLQLLKYTKDISLKINCKRCVWYSTSIEQQDIWDGNHFRKYKQKGNDLGERMAYAIKTGINDKKTSKVVVIGSDCAELTSREIESAFLELDRYDVVIGPAIDGGYYLIGTKEYYPNLFENMTWSTSSVLSDTLERAENLELEVKLLEPLRDVDTLEDWNHIKNRLPDL